jgi:hypothetical protein
MSTASTAPTYEQRLKNNTGYSMAELGRFFEGDSQVHLTLKRITHKLDELGIPYAVSGGMALNRHGYFRATDDVDILATREGLRRIHEELEGLGYVPPFPGSKNLRDVSTGVKIDFLVAGQFPGDGKVKPVAFPDPSDAGMIKDGIRYLKLENLIELKLASAMTAEHRGKDMVDVQELIAAVGLSASFAEQLNEYVRPAYLNCLQKTRRPFVRLWNVPLHDHNLIGLDEVAAVLRTSGGELESMMADGIWLDETYGMQGDFVMVVTDDPQLAARYGMQSREEWLDLEAGAGGISPETDD